MKMMNYNKISRKNKILFAIATIIIFCVTLVTAFIAMRDSVKLENGILSKATDIIVAERYSFEKTLSYLEYQKEMLMIKPNLDKKSITELLKQISDLKKEINNLNKIINSKNSNDIIKKAKEIEIKNNKVPLQKK